MLDKRNQPRAEFELQAFERLSDVFTTLLGESSLTMMLHAVAEALDALVPNMALLLFRLDSERDALVPVVTRGPIGQRLAEVEPSRRDGLIGQVVARREPLLDNDPGFARTGTPDAVIVVPLVARGALWGCLVVYRCGAGASFTQAEFRFVTRFSDAAALALESEETRSQLKLLAHTDELTGVLNRRGFYTTLEHTLAQAQRMGVETSVLVVDLDGLKGINDEHGHDVGDAALTEVANLLACRARAGDLVGRLGGDEFAVGLVATGTEAAHEVASQFEELLDQLAVEAHGATVLARATVGVATIAPTNGTPGELLRSADLDMYRSKQRRRKKPAEPGVTAASGLEAVSGA